MGNPTSHLEGVNFVETWRRNVVDLVTGNGEAEAPDAADVQNKFNDQRSTVRKNARDLGFDGTYRPKVVNRTDEFDTPSLAQLRAKVDAINLPSVVGLVDTWKEISTRNSTSLDTFRKQLARGMAPDVWVGAAATAAAQTVAAYDVTGQKVTTAAALTSGKLDELRTGLEPTKNLVPYPPEHRSGGANLRSFLTGRGWRDDDVAQQNAKAEAVRVLQTVYAPVIHESDTDVPVIPIPKAIENGDDPEIPGGGTQPGNQGTTTQPTTQQPTATPTTPVSTTPTTDPEDTDTSTDDSATPESTTPQSAEPGPTTPASTTPTSTIPGSGSPSGSPGGAGSPGGGSPGAGSPGAGSPGAAAPGGAVPGSPAGGAAAGRGAGAGTAGRSGTPGMMGPGAGKGGGKDDESTKGIPDYLITQEHGDELTGLGESPRTVPPVIGAD